MGLRDLFKNNKGQETQSSRAAPRPSSASRPHSSMDHSYREHDYQADMKHPLFQEYMTEVGPHSGMSFDQFKRMKEAPGLTNSWGQDKTDLHMRGHGDPNRTQEWHAPSPSMARSQPFTTPGPSAATRRPLAGAPHQQAGAPPPPAYTDHLRDSKLNYIPSADIQKALNDQELQNKTERALKNYDIAFLLDDSSSMKRHWDHVKTLLGQLAEEAVKHDENGLDLHFINHGCRYSNLKSAKVVEDVMDEVKPTVGTPMAAALHQILGAYISQLSANGCAAVKCLDLIVITDGVPDDRTQVKQTINACADRLGQLNAPIKQVGIQFIQVGNSRRAREFLVSLDNDNYTSRNIRRDLVDTLHLPELSTVNRATMFKALVGGIDRLIDRNNVWGIGVHHAYDTREGLINGMSDAYMHVMPTHDGHGTVYRPRDQPPGYNGGGMSELLQPPVVHRGGHYDNHHHAHGRQYYEDQSQYYYRH